MAARLCFLATGLLVLLAIAPVSAQPAATVALLGQHFRFSAGELARLRAGEAMARHVATTDHDDVIVIGAVRIAASAEAMAARLRDIERFEVGRGFLATRKLSEPPRLDDFASLHVPRDDIDALRRCRRGRCEVKLGKGALDQVAAVDWRAPGATAQAELLMRRIALSYLEAYRAGGNDALPVYIDKAEPTEVAREFNALLTHARVLLDRAPGLAAHLERYPAQRLDGADEFFYWSLADFGLKPVFRVNHVVIAPADAADGTRFVAATKQLYASHYFHTALEVRLIVSDPDRPDGHYLVVMTLARADGFTGLFGGLIRAKVRSASLDGIRRSLRATKRRIEAH